MTYSRRNTIHRAFARRNTGALSSEERDLLRETLLEEGVDPAMVEEALDTINAIVGDTPDVDVDFILEALDDVVGVYGGTPAPAAAPAAAPAPVPAAPRPMTAAELYPRPVVQDFQRKPIAMVKDLAKIVKALPAEAITEAGKNTILKVASTDPYGSTVRQNTFMRVMSATEVSKATFVEPGERAYNKPPWPTAVEGAEDYDSDNPDLLYRPLFRFFVSVARLLLNPKNINMDAMVQAGGPSLYRDYKDIPIALAVLSDALGIDYDPTQSDALFPEGDRITLKLSEPPLSDLSTSSVNYYIATEYGATSLLTLYFRGFAGDLNSIRDVETRFNRAGYTATVRGSDKIVVTTATIPKLNAILPELKIDKDLLRYLFSMAGVIGPVSLADKPDESLIAMLTAYTQDDEDLLTAYYKHFSETNARGISIAMPSDVRGKLATAEVLKQVVEGTSDFLYFPTIVERAPSYLGTSTARVVADQERGKLSFGFRMERLESKVRIWIPNPWTTGFTGPNTYQIWYRTAPSYIGKSRSGPKMLTLEDGIKGVLRSKYQSKRGPSSQFWAVPASLLSEQGVKWAQEANTFEPAYQNASDWEGPTGPVVLAFGHYELDLNARNLTQDVQTVAWVLEQAGLHPLAAALRIAYGGQAMTPAENPNLPFLSRSPRIEDKMVTGRDGVTLNVTGLATRDTDFAVIEVGDEKVREEAKRLQPPASFRTKEGYTPFDYQRVGIAFALMREGRALLTDEMGLGKTVQALGFLSVNPNPVNNQPALPALIVCPGSVVTNWKKECRAWLPKLKAVIFESGESAKTRVKHDVMITSWQMIALYPDFFQKGGYQTMICDEAHYAKRLYAKGGSKSKSKKTISELLGTSTASNRISWEPYVGLTAAMMLLSKTIPNCLLLTGTPMPNGNPAAYWSYLHTLDHQRFPEFRAFIAEYMPPPPRSRTSPDEITVGQTSTVGGDDGSDPFSTLNRFQKLTNTLDSYQVRRVKQSVADQTNLGRLVIPGEGEALFGATKILVTDYIDLTADQLAYYEEFKAGLTELIKEIHYGHRLNSAVDAILAGGDPGEVVFRVNEEPIDPEKIEAVGLAVATYERQYVGELKVPNAAQWIYNKVAVKKEPAVVWVYHQNVADALEAVLSKMKIGGKPVRYALINSKRNNTPKQKGAIVEAFQGGQLDVVVGSESMAEGVTLVRANEALFTEYWWMPGKLTQAQDRIFRVGQKEDVRITTLHARGTIDDRMERGIEGKDNVLEEVTGVDNYAQETLDTRLDNNRQWMVQVILERLREQIKRASLLSPEVDLGDVLDAVSDNPKNIIEVYSLGAKYREKSVLDFPTKLLVAEDDAIQRVEDTRGINVTNLIAAIVEVLDGAPGKQLPRKDLVARLTLYKGPAVDKEIARLSELGIVTPYQEVGAATRESGTTLRVIEAFQEAGNVLEKPEIKGFVKVPAAKLKDLVAQGVLTLQRKPKVRTNTRRNPGQMVVRGRLPDLPFNPTDAFAFHDHWVPGSPEAVRAEKQRLAAVRKVRNALTRAMKTKRGRLPVLSHAAGRLRHLIQPRYLRDTEMLDAAFDAYNDLRAGVMAHKKAKERVPVEYTHLLHRAHEVLSAYVGS